MRLDFGQLALEDEYGNRYKVQGSDVQMTFGEHREIVHPFCRVHHWIDFSAPIDLARSFQFDDNVAGSPDGGSSDIDLLSQIDVELPEYPLSFAKMTVLAKPIDTFQLKSGETPLATNVPGVEGKLVRVERLENHRLRWHFELANQSSETVIYGFDHQKTYLSADNGNQYKLLQADTNHKPTVNKKAFKAPLLPGMQVSHWFDFSTPANAREFFCKIASHDNSVIVFDLVEAEVPD